MSDDGDRKRMTVTELARLDALLKELDEDAEWNQVSDDATKNASLRDALHKTAAIERKAAAMLREMAAEIVDLKLTRENLEHLTATIGNALPDGWLFGAPSWEDGAVAAIGKLRDRIAAVYAERDKFASGVRGLVVDLCRLSDAFGLPSVGSAEPVDADHILAAIESLKSKRDEWKRLALKPYNQLDDLNKTNATKAAVAHVDKVVAKVAARAASEGNGPND